MSLFDDDPLDSLAYSDSDDDESEELSPKAAEAAAAPEPAAAPSPSPAPAEEGVPPIEEAGHSMFDEDPLADLGMNVDDESMGSRMKGLGGSFSGGLRGRTNSDAAQRMLGGAKAASAKAQAKAREAEAMAKAQATKAQEVRVGPNGTRFLHRSNASLSFPGVLLAACAVCIGRRERHASRRYGQHARLRRHRPHRDRRGHREHQDHGHRQH